MKTNRRRFLATVGATASATLLGPSLFNFKALAATPFVRPDVNTLSATDPILTGYATAVAAMKALSASDQRSWNYQAAIHYTTATTLQPDWDNCQHGTHFFWAWHRMYLYWWERIVRKYSGNPNWVLPYWNWTTNMSLPAPFQVTGISGLYNSHRNTDINNGTGSLPSADVNYSAGFADLDYYNAQSDIETTPHDAVHVDIGGWMASVPTAAMDPIFYLHHANIDRLWDLWLAQGGGRSDPTSDTTWTTQVFHFYDENASAQSMTPCDILNAAAQLNYEYAGEPTQVTQSCGTLPPWAFVYTELLAIPFPPTPIGPDPYTVQVNITNIKQQIFGVLNNPLQQLLLELDGIQTAKQPGATWEVYVGLPAGVAPEPTSPYFVGKLALFGKGVMTDSEHGTFQPAHVRFNATTALSTIVNAGGSSAPISFYARGIVVNGTQQAGRPVSPVTVKEGFFRVQTRSQQG